MHIAFDGGCFQQGILGGIYQVARGFLNAAKAIQPDLRVTLVCDSRQGTVREEALAGLSWRPEVVYGPVAASYDVPEEWPALRDPQLRFFVDGQIIPAALHGDVAIYEGPRPSQSFAIVSRVAPSPEAPSGGRRGVRIELIQIENTESGGRLMRINGGDRRLVTGFVDSAEGRRWTDGAGFIPIGFFAEGAGTVRVEVAYTPQDSYAMPPGEGVDIVRQIRQDHRTAERKRALASLANNLKRQGCTVYFANHFTPIHLPGIVNVAWAYDLIPVLLPQYFHADARLNFDENLRIFCAANRVYAISDSTRDDLIANTPVSASQAVTAGIAASGDFSRRPQASIQRVVARHGLRNGDYIIAVATIEPRKNHMRLLMAYQDLRRRMPSCPDLLFVGNMGWDFGQVLALREDSGLEHSVKILSDVSDEDLACLYSGAMFSTYLSVYEGFGLPIIEAMAAGCAVLTSDRSSMVEVAADAAMTTNPYDIDGITAALHRLSTDPKLRQDLVRRGLERARHYSWHRSSSIILNDLAGLLGES